MSRRERRRARVPSAAIVPPPPPRGVGVAVLRYGAWIALGLAVLHVALALVTLIPAPHTGGDNTAYLALARSLLERGEYLSLWEPGAPPHTQYPPAFPAILALAMAIGLEPWVPLKLVVILLSAAAVAVSFLWIRRMRQPRLALAVGLVLAMSPGVLEQGRWILSDVPFWAFTMLALWAFEGLRRNTHARFGVAVAATVLAYFTRSAGLPLVVAALLWLAIRRRWLQLGLLAGVIMPLALLWWLRSRGVDTLDYVEQFWLVDPYAQDSGRIGPSGLLQRISENAGKYLTVHLPILLFGRTGSALLVASFPVVGLAVAGWALRVRRLGLAELFLPLYLGLLLIWPAVWSGERFLLPALPLILVEASIALAWVARRVHAAAPRPVGAVAAALLVVLAWPSLGEAARIGGMCREQTRLGGPTACLPAPWLEFFDTAEWARTTLPEDAVVLSRKPRLFYWFSGRTGRIYPLREDPAALFEESEAIGARWVVFDALGGLARVYVVPALLRKPDAFCLARPPLPNGTAVFGIRENASAIPDRPLAEGDVGFSPCGEEFFAASSANGS